jgi:hypothetical protein
VAGTEVVLLAGDGVPVTEMIDEVNWLRASVAAELLHDVWLFPGDPPSLYGSGPEPLGARFHDRVVADYVERARSGLDAGSVIAASAPVDPEATAEARDVGGARPFGEDAVLLPARLGSTAVTVPESGDVSLLAPWTVPIWATLLIAGLALTGLGWTRWSVPRRPLLERVALSPAIGFAILTITSVLVDTVGLRLGSGGSVAAVLIGLLPGAVLGVRARALERRSEEAG